jgi:hypothetical protein
MLLVEEDEKLGIHARSAKASVSLMLFFFFLYAILLVYYSEKRAE